MFNTVYKSWEAALAARQAVLRLCCWLISPQRSGDSVTTQHVHFTQFGLFMGGLLLLLQKHKQAPNKTPNQTDLKVLGRTLFCRLHLLIYRITHGITEC